MYADAEIDTAFTGLIELRMLKLLLMTFFFNIVKSV